MKEYVLYENEEVLAIGTVEEIAKKMRIKNQTVRFYGTNSYKKRNNKSPRVLVALEEDSKTYKKDCFADDGSSCKILRKKDCENCNFFKRKEDVAEEMERYYKDKRYRRNQGC